MKYEVKVITELHREANKALMEEQNNGWEIAGQISVTPNWPHLGSALLSIPLKREIK